MFTERKDQDQFIIIKLEKNLKTGFEKSKESFSKGFMIVADFIYNNEIKVQKVEKNAIMYCIYH